MRFGLNRALAFSEDDQRENIRRIAEVVHLFNQADLIVLFPVISPFHLSYSCKRIASDLSLKRCTLFMLAQNSRNTTSVRLRCL